MLADPLADIRWINTPHLLRVEVGGSPMESKIRAGHDATPAGFSWHCPQGKPVCCANTRVAAAFRGKTIIVTPNSDTPYSFVRMDLRAEPIVLSVPAVDPKRYYAVQLEDGNTYNYGYIGARTTGSGPGDYMAA